MKEKGAAGIELESHCLVTQDQAGPLGLRLLASSPVAVSLTWALGRRNCSCPCRSLPVPTRLFQEEPVDTCSLCPEIRERYFGVKPRRSLEVLQNLKYLASKFSTSACTIQWLAPLPHVRPTARRGSTCWLSATLQVSLVTSGPAEVGVMSLAWRASSAPSASKASKGFASTGGLTSLHIWLGCANKQKEAASPCLFLIPKTEWNKADEQGSLILFCRAPQFSVSRDPESVIPCQRLSTIHWQGTINLDVLL